jgi:serine/threonine protein kinase/WD40 repeat protein/Flp pilus assembly protein TadD
MNGIDQAFVCMSQGKYPEAQEIYQKMLHFSPGHIVARYELGWAYLMQRKYSDAEAAWQEVAAVLPNNPFVLQALARTCLLQQKYKDTQRILRKMIGLLPQDVISQQQLRLVLHLQGTEEGDDVPLTMPEEPQSPESGEPPMFTPGDAPGGGFGEATMADPQVMARALAKGALCDAGVHQLSSKSTPSARATTATAIPGELRQTKTQTNLPTGASPAAMILDDFLYKERLLGQGGMGEVFLVRHLDWDKRVAVKRCLRTDNQLLLDRFRQECLAWLSLEKHPNVVSAVHFTTWEGKPSLLIEYIEGTTLKDVIRNLHVLTMRDLIVNKLGTRPALGKVMALLTFFGGGEERKEIGEAWMTIMQEYSQLSSAELRNILHEAFQEHEIEYLQNRWSHLTNLRQSQRLGQREMLDYAIQMCCGMAHAHVHGMLHRDLKPANILIEEEMNGPGVLKVTDFGLAKIKGKEGEHEKPALLENNAEDESSSGIVGTPRYMSPEQWGGNTSEKSDIYAFGMILYELFTCGHSPFLSHIEEQQKTGTWWTAIPQQNEFYYWSVRHGSEAPILPSVYARELPKEIENLILRCLAKEADKRPGSFAEIAAELLPIFATVTGSSYPREQSISPDLMAMELNNRAVSLLEMNFGDDGRRLLEKAIAVSPNLTEVQLNYSLYELLNGRLSLSEFIAKTLNCFNMSDRDILVFSILAGLYYQHGCFYQVVAKKLQEIEKKFAKDWKLRRLKGKLYYLTGNFAQAQEIWQELCALENARLEDWYHLLGCLYYQGKREAIQKLLEQAQPHFKSHPAFREIKRLLRDSLPTMVLKKEERRWYETAMLESAYGEDEDISFLKSDETQEYFLVFRSSPRRNLCEYYRVQDWQYKSCSIPVSNQLSEKQVAFLASGYIAVLSLEGGVYLQKIGTNQSKTLPCCSKEVVCQDGFLHKSDPYFLSVHHALDKNGRVYSYINLWLQNTCEKVSTLQLAGSIVAACMHVKEEICWLADRCNLYRWEFKQEAAPSAQPYGYSQEQNGVRCEAELIGLYALSNLRLLVLQQTRQLSSSGAMEQASVQLYLWDLQNGDKHKNHTMEKSLIVSHTLAQDKNSLFLLSSGDGLPARFVCWDLYTWRTTQQTELDGSFQNMEISGDGFFALLQSKPLLDIAVNFLSPTAGDSTLYITDPWHPAERFQSVPSICHINGVLPGILCVASSEQKVYVWKMVGQDTFPLLHRMSYLHLKPTSTLQDIGLQRRIQKLLAESAKALEHKELQRALDYLRGIQNFKGYDWKQIMERIYDMATAHQWYKIGLRESLKSKKFTWPEPNFLVSPDGQYLIPITMSSDRLPALFDIGLLQEKTVPLAAGDGQSLGTCFPSLDGRYLLQQSGKQTIIYDVQKQVQVSAIESPVVFQEAVSSQEGNVLLLKETGMGRIGIWDMSKKRLQFPITDTKYHTLQDCCVVSGSEKILLAAETEGGFRWQMLKKAGEIWKSKFYELPFAEDLIRQGKTDAEDSEVNIIANRSYVIFRGTNFDLSRDIHFRHIEVFELKHELCISLKEERFCKAWLSARTIATTPDGGYTFLAVNQAISGWRTSGHIKNWKQVILLQEHQHPVSAMVVTSDGRFLISADQTGDIKIIRIGVPKDNLMWEQGDWEVIDTLKADAAISRLYVSQGDRYLFACCPNAIHVWEFDWLWHIEKYVE